MIAPPSENGGGDAEQFERAGAGLPHGHRAAGGDGFEIDHHAAAGALLADDEGCRARRAGEVERAAHHDKLSFAIAAHDRKILCGQHGAGRPG